MLSNKQLQAAAGETKMVSCTGSTSWHRRARESAFPHVLFPSRAGPASIPASRHSSLLGSLRVSLGGRGQGFSAKVLFLIAVVWSSRIWKLAGGCGGWPRWQDPALQPLPDRCESSG